MKKFFTCRRELTHTTIQMCESLPSKSSVWTDIWLYQQWLIVWNKVYCWREKHDRQTTLPFTDQFWSLMIYSLRFLLRRNFEDLTSCDKGQHTTYAQHVFLLLYSHSKKKVWTHLSSWRQIAMQCNPLWYHAIIIIWKRCCCVFWVWLITPGWSKTTMVVSDCCKRHHSKKPYRQSKIQAQVVTSPSQTEQHHTFDQRHPPPNTKLQIQRTNTIYSAYMQEMQGQATKTRGPYKLIRKMKTQPRTRQAWRKPTATHTQLKTSKCWLF